MLELLKSGSWTDFKTTVVLLKTQYSCLKKIHVKPTWGSENMKSHRTQDHFIWVFLYLIWAHRGSHCSSSSTGNGSSSGGRGRCKEKETHTGQENSQNNLWMTKHSMTAVYTTTISLCRTEPKVGPKSTTQSQEAKSSPFKTEVPYTGGQTIRQRYRWNCHKEEDELALEEGSGE